MRHSLILRYSAMNHARFEITTTATSDQSTCTVACDLISRQLQAGILSAAVSEGALQGHAKSGTRLWHGR